ncbi:splicing regulator ARVCF [Salvelinus sp. IW2-2015]|uniref:splicing regulator ARVCF n=1 Tax=Salvelinus sp. IW2-2015 TaxID=2691554 RepID=UPI000CDFEB57|nr:armadillo repeat protein deleted in velo-cardio-facial syndrome [Salvelinus alpinus]XP_023839461.1 armadillo repeat protein deleted in velo-cardio-facial syndrome [Salvelinus alpinus]
MPAEVKEEQIPGGPSSLSAITLETKESHVEPTDDDLSTPTSNSSVVTSTNGSSTAETEAPQHTEDPKVVELANDQADTPNTPDTPTPQLPPAPQLPPVPQHLPVTQVPMCPDNPSLQPSPLTNVQNSSESLTPIITTTATITTLPPPYNNTDRDPNTEIPERQNNIYTLPDPPFPGLGGAMYSGYGSLSRGGVHHSSPHTYWPSRNYQTQPGGHYTLPLPRDNYGQVGLTNQTEGEGPGDAQDVKADYPTSSYATLGGNHYLRPITTMELLMEPSRTRGGYEEALMSQVDGDPTSFFQAMSRAQMLQFPHKRCSMVSLDSIRKDPRWRDPNLREVITMLSHPMDPVKSNAAAYLQHLCYENDHMKQDVRQLKGVPVLVGLLDHPKAEVHRKACGALRNISYGKDHHNKVAIKNCDGIPALVRLLRKSSNMEVTELVTGTLWNLSSHEPLKMMIINHGLQTLTDEVIIPHSGWRRDPTEHSRPQETEWTTVFKNTSGCLRNVSSDGAEARQRLRECEGLVDALLHALQSAVAHKETDNKSVENCVCILRNLSYHVHKEVPGAERFQEPVANQVPGLGGNQKKKKEADCFGGKKPKEEWFSQSWRNGPSDKKYGTLDLPKRTEPMKGLELLYQPEVVRLYLSLLTCSQNHNTLEAAAGALQNLAAGHWAWSSYIRATVRKEKGLPVLVELLRSDGDKVVRAVAIALRNLAIDRRNKDLIGNYAMRDLVSNLPCGQQRPAKNLEGDTVVAILNTIHEIISDSPENARGLIQGHAIQKLVAINKTSQSERETKAASHVLQTVWAYKDLRNSLYKGGWNKSHFKPTTSGMPKKPKSGKSGYDDITLPLMEKNQDGYSTVEQGDRVGDGPGYMMERESLQSIPERKHFIRAGRPAVGLVERKPPPLDSWV